MRQLVWLTIGTALGGGGGVTAAGGTTAVARRRSDPHQPGPPESPRAPGLRRRRRRRLLRPGTTLDRRPLQNGSNGGNNGDGNGGGDGRHFFSDWNGWRDGEDGSRALFFSDGQGGSGNSSFDGKDLPNVQPPDCAYIQSFWDQIQDSLLSGRQDGDYFWQAPCRNESSFIAIDDNSTAAPSYGGDNANDATVVLDAHQIRFGLKVGLPPQRVSIAPTVQRVLTQLLNDANAAFSVRISNLFWRNLQQQQSGGNNTNIANSTFSLIWNSTDSYLFSKLNRRWWWQYNIIYDVYVTRNDTAVTRPAVLQRIYNMLASVMESTVSSGQFAIDLLDALGDDTYQLRVSVEDEVDGDDDAGPMVTDDGGEYFIGSGPSGDDGHISLTPPDNVGDTVDGGKEEGEGPRTKQPTTGDVEGGDDQGAETTNNGNIFATAPLNPHAWDGRRYFGLALFVSMATLSMLVSQIGAYRQRQRHTRQLWSNLGSEQGVEELLKTGWKIQDEQHILHVYDKDGVGYRDDDSMLIGGFEQSEQVVGAEITVTYPNTNSSQATPPLTSGGDGGSGVGTGMSSSGLGGGGSGMAGTTADQGSHSQQDSTSRQS